MTLVEQERLDRSATTARERTQMLSGEALLERLHTQASRKETLELIDSEYQLAGTEAARIDDHESLAARARLPVGCSSRSD